MKKISLNSKAFGKWIILPALALITLTIDSCKKESGIGSTTPTVSSATAEKKAKLDGNVSKALRDLVISGAVSNDQSGAGSGSSSYSNTSLNVTTYSTPSANVYSWSDPTTGASYTLSESTTGGGLGQLSYNGKSFDYNYVMCIKANAGDAMWDGFFSGRDLRGVVAIDGEIMDTDFSLKNLAIFLVSTTGGEGTYDFIDWDSQHFTSGDAIGELLDFSDVTNNTLAGMDQAKFYITSNGSIEVTETSFTMSSNAKVTDVMTGAEYAIDGSISCE